MVVSPGAQGWLGDGPGTAALHLTQQPPGQCAYLPAMTFFFLFFKIFLALTVLVTVVSQADTVVISTTNQNSCCCDCQFVWSLKPWIKGSIFKRSVPHWGKNVNHKVKETEFVCLVYDVNQCCIIYWFLLLKIPLSNVFVCHCFI